jgi:hypothetical protein
VRAIDPFGAATRNCSQSDARASAQEVHLNKNEQSRLRNYFTNERRAGDPAAPLAMAGCGLPGKGTGTGSFRRTFPVSCRGWRASNKPQLRFFDAVHDSTSASLRLLAVDAVMQRAPWPFAHASSLHPRGNAASSLIGVGGGALTNSHNCPIPPVPTEPSCETHIGWPPSCIFRHLACLVPSKPSSLSFLSSSHLSTGPATVWRSQRRAAH